MKTNRISVIMVIILIISWNKGSGQWYYHQLTPGSNFNSLAFTDENTGFICGDSHILKKTTDGGVTWNSLTIDAKGNLVSIKFPTSNTGYVASDSGQIFKTTDAGQNWTIIKALRIPIKQFIFMRLYFFNRDTGILACDSSKSHARIYRTTDGGINWTNAQLPDSVAFFYKYPQAICFSNELVGYIAHQYGILKTVDAGLSWTQLENYMGGNSLSYPDNLHAFFVSMRSLYESNDGGLTWNSKVDVGNPSYVYFTSVDTGYVCVDTTILQTTNAGISWNPMKIYYGFPIAGVTVVKTEMCFPAKYIGYAVGPGGSFLNCNLNANGIGDKTNLQPDVQLMQNPVMGPSIRFQINKHPVTGSIHIYNCLGNEVKKVDNLTKGIVEINRIDLSPGLYLYKYIDKEKINSFGKIIIN